MAMFSKSSKPQNRIDSLIGATTREGLLTAPLLSRFAPARVGASLFRGRGISQCR